MINFFRRIRKKLADDNKPLKYMRYAIGEIVLVIVGILIAIQVNNWNEARKAEMQAEIVRQSYLNSIYKDLKSDVRTIDYNLNRFLNQYKSGIEVLEIFESKEHKVIDSARIVHLIGWELTDVIPNSRNENTWDGLKVEGKQALLKNDSLSALLNTFYNGFDRLIERFNQLPRKARMDLRELVSQCHHTHDLKIYYEKGVKNYGDVIGPSWKCTFEISNLSKLLSSITMSAIVNRELYIEMSITAESTILYMENKYPFLRNTL